jgi:nucleotide-binding universal stress UspA family protein
MPLDAIRSIFLPFCADAEGKTPASCRFAYALAAEAGAHLSWRALATSFDAPATFAPGFVGSLVGNANQEERKRAEAAMEAMRKLATDHGIHFDEALWQDGAHQLAARAARAGRLADLAIIDEPGGFVMIGQALAEELLFHSGRPVLITPKSGASTRIERVLIAWDGSQRAARAVGDAMPFLKAAHAVQIVTVTNEKELAHAAPGADIATHLSRHGVRTEIVNLAPADRVAAFAIRRQAEQSRADLIVMGGYAHSWLRQIVWGGVTSTMLDAPPAPLLMSF